MKIEIRRYRIKGECCDSLLYVDGSKVCDCAENALHRAPAGTYRVDIRYNRQVGRRVPSLRPMDSESTSCDKGLAIVMGNGIYMLKNQIIVGTYIAPGCVKCSREPFMLLYNRINISLRRGHQVTLTIIEPPDL